jgi:hypothetical protein
MKVMRNLVLVFVIMISGQLYSQIAINTDGSDADGSALVDMKSTESGMLIPRMTENNRDNISNPATGLMIYQTDGNSGFYYFNGSNWVTFENSPTYEVGDFAHGGIVFYVDNSGQHGLVCSKEDQTPNGVGRMWVGSAGFPHMQAVGEGFYTGYENTIVIIAGTSGQTVTTDNYAARLCYQYTVVENGVEYNDWYLPAKDELNEMFQNKAIINSTAIANSGENFEEGIYWSSTETAASIGTVYCQYFTSGVQFDQSKDNQYHVRAIRAF